MKDEVDELDAGKKKKDKKGGRFGSMLGKAMGSSKNKPRAASTALMNEDFIMYGNAEDDGDRANSFSEDPLAA